MTIRSEKNSKNDTVKIMIVLRVDSDSDIIEQINMHVNKTQYIRDAIRRDMAANPQIDIQDQPKSKHGLIDLTGLRFNHWTVIEKIPGSSPTKWKCRCDCGNIGFVTSSSLRKGMSKNCQSCKWKNGSYGEREYTSPAPRMVKGIRTKPYRSYEAIKARCYNPKHVSYSNYGGRGIKLCDEWYNSYEKFYDYVTSLPNYETPETTIDRIDNDKGYEPGNIRWATRKEQNENKRPVATKKEK